MIILLNIQINYDSDIREYLKYECNIDNKNISEDKYKELVRKKEAELFENVEKSLAEFSKYIFKWSW